MCFASDEVSTACKSVLVLSADSSFAAPESATREAINRQTAKMSDIKPPCSAIWNMIGVKKAD